MNIYLVQHGKPIPKEEDPDRPLSVQGKNDVERMADFLLKAGIHLEEIFHSGKTRAGQTAEIIAYRLKPGDTPLIKETLAPLADVKVIAEEIGQNQKDIMLVGHLPHLAKLTAYLTSGNESGSVVGFQQGGVVCLRREADGEGWTIAWMLIPEIIK